MWTLRKVPLTELSAHAELTLQGVDTQRLTMVLKLLAGTLRRQCYRDLWLLQMVHGHDATDVHSPLGDGSQHRFVEDTLSAMESIKAIGLLAVRSSTDSASLLAFGPQLVPPIHCSTTHETLGGRESRWRGAVELFAEFSRMLAAEGIAFLQAMRPGDEDAPLLIRLGFEELARLDYLVAAAELRGGEGDGGIAGPPGSRLIPYPQWADQQRNLQHDPKERLIDLINRTYEGSLDCPRFASYRSTTQVVDGYLSHPQAAPELWRIALDQAERESGCILLTPYSESGCMEITYMGVVPPARGKGLAGQLVTWAKQATLQLGYTQVSLAVDRNNHFAQSVYRKHGFSEFLNETVWGYATSSPDQYL